MREREASDADYEPLWHLHVATMRQYVDATWGWVEAEQADMFRQAWPRRAGQRVVVDDEAVVGCWLLEHRADELFIAFIEVAPSHQGRGIGGGIVRCALARAAAQGLPVALTVLKANWRARRLYERLGFSLVSETATHFRMVAKPLPSRHASST